MGFPGTWVNEDRSLVYRVVPKCACSTIGQIMYFGDHGAFYDGDIHDATEGIYKWNQEHNQALITETVQGSGALTFTFVRNPFTRILSAFFDKIAGIQRNGRRYRGNLVPMLTRKYGVDVEDGFDQIESFRRFLLFTRDTIRFRKPMDPDIHWSPQAGHISTLIRGGGRYDLIQATESFDAGMRAVLDRTSLRHPVDLKGLPRFNESEGHGPKRAFPVEDYFDDLATYIVHDMYKKDFQLFRYSKEPGGGPPVEEMDLDHVHQRLG